MNGDAVFAKRRKRDVFLSMNLVGNHLAPRAPLYPCPALLICGLFGEH
jgi:hypothetical protein